MAGKDSLLFGALDRGEELMLVRLFELLPSLYPQLRVSFSSSLSLGIKQKW